MYESNEFYLSYSTILNRLKLLNIKTHTNKEINIKDLRQAINIMDKKHNNCRWKYKKINNNRKYVLIEGYYWLIYVYFQNEKRQIDADIEFFENRIKQYEKLLFVERKIMWNTDMYEYQLEKYFNRSAETIRKNIMKMNKNTKGFYIYYENGKRKISKLGVEWLCKNCFKRRYLEILEDYKMQLTDKYIQSGYIYDNFY